MKLITISILIAGVLIAGAILYTTSVSKNTEAFSKNNVTVVNGVQIVEISVFGGYTPERSVAKTGVPTILRFKTNNTFDCSSSIRIPSMHITKVLPKTGDTDINLGSPRAGTVQGFCGMGMYSFSIDFLP